MQPFNQGGRTEVLPSTSNTRVSERVLYELLTIREHMGALYEGLLSHDGEARHINREGTPGPSKAFSLHATFFGSFALFRDGARVALGHNRTVLELCRFLIAHAGRAVSRDELVDILWPGAEPEQAVHRLHVTISRLRHLVDPPGSTESLILLDDDNYLWTAGSVSTDCVWFENYYRQGRLSLAKHDAPEAASAFQSAVDLYNGEYLAEHPFVEWTQPRRAHFAERQLNALAFLTEYAAAEHNHMGVLEYAQAILELDNLRERAHRQIMRAHHALGQRACAVRQYHACAQILRNELGIEPSEQTIELFHAVCNRKELPAEVPIPM